MTTLKALADKLRKARDPLEPFGSYAYYRIADIDAVIAELETKDMTDEFTHAGPIL